LAGVQALYFEASGKNLMVAKTSSMETNRAPFRNIREALR
jgi:hypothetical protein